MRLLIFHHHFRPGGVRRVIELGASHIAESIGPVSEIVLGSGEAVEPAWLRSFKERVAPRRVSVVVDPAFAYVSETDLRFPDLRRRLAISLPRLLKDADGARCLVWAHNLSLGRNLPLAEALSKAAEAANATVVLHHHDWWFDNRWQRWPEMRRSGFGQLRRVADTLFSVSPCIRHVAINRADARLLQRGLGNATWIPNPISQASPAASPEIRYAKQWLKNAIGADAPVWMLPVRLIRRKNIAEAMLLTRWLRPEAFLVTTAGPSSPEEEDYAHRLSAAITGKHWRVRLGALSAVKGRGPAVPALLGASEVVLMTSLQEGFGLPYLEAASASRPLISRFLPNVLPDLQSLGMKFPQTYSEVLIDAALFKWGAELERQKRLFQRWRADLPAGFRRLASEPELLRKRAGDPVPFSRLTLSAQLQVLSVDPHQSWGACTRLNPCLATWRDAASAGRLAQTALPSRTVRRLSGAAYGAKFARLAGRLSSLYAERSTHDVLALQREFVREKLQDLYPLMFESRT